MSWFKRQRRPTSREAEIADTLHRIIVDEETSKFFQPDTFDLASHLYEPFKLKARLYHEALILFVLILKASEDKSYEPVLQAYERLVLPSTPTPEGMTKHEALKGAMSNLGTLLDTSGDSGSDPPVKRFLPWSKSWLAGVGHDEGNPVVLTLFLKHWVGMYTAICNSLEELIPPSVTGVPKNSVVIEDAQRLITVVSQVADRIGEAPIASGESGVYVHPELIRELEKPENKGLYEILVEIGRNTS